MDVRDAVASRYSCRAFLPTPVSLAIVRDILDRAGRAPSGGNVQPWLVHALTGAPLEQLKVLLRPRLAAELPDGEGAEYPIYPDPLKEPYRSRRFEAGEIMFGSIGIPRDDRPARIRQYGRNFEFFDAPAGLFFSLDRSMGWPQKSDLGGYVQTVMLLARAHGLHTCAQEAWIHWHKTLPPFLGMPPDPILFCGMALGYADESAPINRWHSPRAPLDEIATFRGFADAAES